jgi:uncharacterized surface protein with fasciclin (FAS1) repeats
LSTFNIPGWLDRIWLTAGFFITLILVGFSPIEKTGIYLIYIRPPIEDHKPVALIAFGNGGLNNQQNSISQKMHSKGVLVMKIPNLKQLATLLSTCLLAAFALAGCEADRMQKKDIVDTAVAAGNFNTLVTAVKAADLVQTLKGKGPFTVFAPTDAAFAKLPAGTLDNLLMPANKSKLAGILTYHVVPGKVTSAKVVTMSQAKTVNGQMLKITAMGGKVMVDGATVVNTDIECSNGVIHVIDSVVMPK